MKFKTESIDGITVIKLPVDALDASNVMDFKSDITPYLTQSDKVILNMGRVKFMDSSGIGAVLSCLRTVHENGGRLKMFGLREQLIQLFKLVRMDRIIDAYDSRKAAVESFQTSPEI